VVAPTELAKPAGEAVGAVRRAVTDTVPDAVGTSSPDVTRIADDAVAAVDRVAATSSDLTRSVANGTTEALASGSIRSVADHVDPIVGSTIRSLGGSPVTVGAPAGGGTPGAPAALPIGLGQSMLSPVAVPDTEAARTAGLSDVLPDVESARTGATEGGAVTGPLASVDPTALAAYGGNASSERAAGAVPAQTPAPAHNGPAPSAAFASAGGSSAVAAFALLLLFALAIPMLLLTLKEAPAFLRPVTFVALLERPG
jgi:hypothetical protein